MCTSDDSRRSTLAGRFSNARCMPARSLSSSKGWRLPSCLIRRGITSSAVSKVVKRSPQARHSRRRRTCSPSATRRESMTLVSLAPQKGQCIKARQPEKEVHGSASDWQDKPQALRYTGARTFLRSEEHTSELQSQFHL